MKRFRAIVVTSFIVFGGVASASPASADPPIQLPDLGEPHVFCVEYAIASLNRLCIPLP